MLEEGVIVARRCHGCPLIRGEGGGLGRVMRVSAHPTAFCKRETGTTGKGIGARLLATPRNA
jgi:hypothetical protein